MHQPMTCREHSVQGKGMAVLATRGVTLVLQVLQPRRCGDCTGTPEQLMTIGERVCRGLALPGLSHEVRADDLLSGGEELTAEAGQPQLPAATPGASVSRDAPAWRSQLEHVVARCVSEGLTLLIRLRSRVSLLWCPMCSRFIPCGYPRTTKYPRVCHGGFTDDWCITACVGRNSDGLESLDVNLLVGLQRRDQRNEQGIEFRFVPRSGPDPEPRLPSSCRRQVPNPLRAESRLVEVRSPCCQPNEG